MLGTEADCAQSLTRKVRQRSNVPHLSIIGPTRITIWNIWPVQYNKEVKHMMLSPHLEKHYNR